MSSTLAPGFVIAETYEVTRLLGRGGMGEVWLATHRRLPGKQVAIKVLHTGGQALSADALTRFQREAQVATRIDHPNIVEVHDFNTLPDGSPYLVLEFLQGESLASRLRYGPMSVEETKAILRQVGSALQASHAHGVVHRDLKPDNIFLVPTAVGIKVKVLDFGISKLVDSATLQTQEAVLIGTPAYMSPEQALGNNKEVGPQSDVFAVGAIAYEMLSGKPPFAAESIAQLVFKIAYQPHPPLATVKEGLPAPLIQAVEHALLKDRAHRTQDIAAFVGEFTGEPLPAVRHPSEEPSSSHAGIASPGMATPDSLMMAKTEAPTPRTPAPAAPPLAPAPPTPTATWKLALAGAGSLLLVTAAMLALRQQPPRAPLRSLPVATPPVEQLAVLDAGAPPVVAQAAVPAEADAGVAATELDAGASSAKPPRGRPNVLRPSGEELARNPKLKALEQSVQAGNFDLAFVEAQNAMRLTLSPVGKSWAAMLATEAACGHKDQVVANARFHSIDLPAHSAAAKDFCAHYGVTLSP